MTRRPVETAADQLRRVLHLVPMLADDRDHPIDDVANAVGIGRSALLKDLESLANRFDDPGGFVEGVRIFIDQDTVSVSSSHFLRPMRLTRAELAALELGLAMLRAERPPEEHRAIDGARARLAAVLARTPGEPEPEVLQAADGGYPHRDDAPRRKLLRQAIRERHKVRIDYQKPSDLAPESRTVCPYSLVLTRGMWYLVAQCESGDGLRFFRMDRITGAAMGTERFRLPADFSVGELVRGERMFQGESAVPLVVRYSPKIARWIAEREGQPLAADGSLTLTHPLADEDWAVRHVLQYGPDAEVISPESVRDALRQRIASMIDSA
jgi:proteasome accessory factor C